MGLLTKLNKKTLALCALVFIISNVAITLRMQKKFIMHINITVPLKDTTKTKVAVAQIALFNAIQQHINMLVQQHTQLVDSDIGISAYICDEENNAVY